MHSPYRIGLLFLLALIAVVAYVAVDRPAERSRAAEASTPVAAIGTTTAVAAADAATNASARAAPSAPVTPVYTSRAEPPAAAPIYRCRVGSRTVYTQDPCDDGRIVDTANAVGGFETKPSDRLERLVSDGRTEATANVAPSPVVRETSRRTSVECETYAQQIRDLDAEALLPNTARGQDRIRRIRQDVRTSMARERC